MPRMILAAAAGFALGRPLSAQQVSMRLGGIAARYADSINAQAGALSLRLVAGSSTANGAVDANWALFEGGDAAGQGWGRFVLLGPSSRHAGVALRGDGVTNVIRGGPWSAEGTLEGIGVLSLGRLTFSLSAVGGGVHKLDGTGTPQGGAVLRAFTGTQAITVTALAQGVVAADIRFADFTLMADWQHGRVRAGGLIATRRGDLATGAWGQAYVSVALAPALAVEVSLGGYPRDITGFDQGQYANVGLRVLFCPPDRSSSSYSGPVATTSGPPAQPDPDAPIVERVTDTAARVTFTVAGADSVAIAGEWNDWTPLPLEPLGNDRWSGIVPLAPGAHRFALVVNGSRWTVPATVAKLPDDFGGEVGLLVVP